MKHVSKLSLFSMGNSMGEIDSAPAFNSQSLNPGMGWAKDMKLCSGISKLLQTIKTFESENLLNLLSMSFPRICCLTYSPFI